MLALASPGAGGLPSLLEVTSMTTRRAALRTSALAAAAALLPRASPAEASPAPEGNRPSRRPAPGARRFRSEAVEATIAAVRRDVADPELAWLFENCFPNTLDT